MQSPIATTKAPRSVKNASAGRIKSTTGPRIPLSSKSAQPKGLTTINGR